MGNGVDGNLKPPIQYDTQYTHGGSTSDGLPGDGTYNVLIDRETNKVILYQVGANTTDTIVQFTMDSKQYLRMTGSFSLNSSNPKIPPPGGDGGDPGIKQLHSNPWFNPSFLANFNNIMAELFDLNSQTRFLEGKLEIKGGQIELAIAKDKSEMTKLATDARVAEKQVEAMAAFAQAAISGVAMHQTMHNSVKARQECVAERDTEVSNLKNRKAGYETENEPLKTQNDNKRLRNKALHAENKALAEQLNPSKDKVVMTSSAADLEKAKPLPLNPQEREAKIQKMKDNDLEIEDNNRIIDVNEKKIANNETLATKTQTSIDEISTDHNLDNKINVRTQALNLISNSQKEIMSNVVNGCSKFLEGAYEKEAGYDDAFIQELDGYARAMQRYTDSASKAADKSASLTDAINNLMMKITDNSFQASNIGHA